MRIIFGIFKYQCISDEKKTNKLTFGLMFRTDFNENSNADFACYEKLHLCCCCFFLKKSVIGTDVCI